MLSLSFNCILCCIHNCCFHNCPFCRWKLLETIIRLKRRHCIVVLFCFFNSGSFPCLQKICSRVFSYADKWQMFALTVYAIFKHYKHHRDLPKTRDTNFAVLFSRQGLFERQCLFERNTRKHAHHADINNKTINECMQKLQFQNIIKNV